MEPNPAINFHPKNSSQFFSDITVVYQSLCCRTKADQLRYDWITLKIWPKTIVCNCQKVGIARVCWFCCDIFSIPLTHKESHREVYQEFQLSYDIVRRWCQGLFRTQVPCTPSLHCPIASSASTQSQQPV